MIQELLYNPNEKVLAEIAAIERSRDRSKKKLDDSPTLESYFAPLISSCAGRELKAKLNLSRKSKILDVGFGRGETSLYLASLGHEVHAVEPSSLHCEILNEANQKYGTKIRIYQGTIESFDQMSETDFDLCLFNASLHHCDEPITALQICNKKLNSTGRTIAINEPLLKFYRSKSWFYKKLETDPISMGHYGGNEHIYYYHEYVNFFKAAGFPHVTGTLHIRNQNPRLVLQEDLQRQIEGKYVHTDGKLLLKFFILLMLKSLWSKPVINLGKKLSLFPYSFEASKLECGAQLSNKS